MVINSFILGIKAFAKLANEKQNQLNVLVAIQQKRFVRVVLRAFVHLACVLFSRVELSKLNYKIEIVLG